MSAFILSYPHPVPDAASPDAVAGYEALGTQVVLLVLSALAILLLLLIGWAVFLRLRRRRLENRRSALTRRWSPVLDDILARRRFFTALDETVSLSHTDAFLAFLHRRAMEASPAQLAWIRIVARPYLAFSNPPSATQTAEQRAYRIHQLGWLGSDDAEPVLRLALEDPSPFVAMVALRALIRRHTARSASLSTSEKEDFAHFVVSHLSRFGDWRQRSLAVLLAQVSAIAPPLRQLLTDRRAATWVRALAASTLKQMSDPKAAEPAVRILRRDHTLPLQTAALRLLEAVGSRRHVPLLQALCTADNEVIRIRALSALAHVGDASNVPLFEEALGDPSRWVARQAAFGLMRLGHPRALRALADSDHPRAVLAYQVLTRHRLAA